MSLTKAMLVWWTVIPPMGGSITCQFNPSSLKITKENEWKGEPSPNWNSPFNRYTGGKSATYSLSLFFDSYQDHPDGSGPKDVREYTNQLLQLSLRGAGYAMFKLPNAWPPFVKLIWGKIVLFEAVVTKVEVEYIMFAPEGYPIRAKADVSFIQNEFLLSDDIVPAQNPTSRTDARKTRLVHAGERLDQIAYEEYRDSRLWRTLAEANSLDDPFSLNDGQLLVIPPIE
jgi:nucleoid-associated protein YgaU